MLVFSHTNVFCKAGGSTTIYLWLHVSVMCCFIFYSSPSILALLYVILLQRFSISTVSLCTRHLYFSTKLIQAFCVSRGPQRHVFIFNIMPPVGLISWNILIVVFCFFFNFSSKRNTACSLQTQNITNLRGATKQTW